MNYSSYQSNEPVTLDKPIQNPEAAAKKKSKVVEKVQNMKTTTMLLYILVGTIAIVVYIGNILAVKDLMKENIELKETLSKEQNASETLKSQVDQLENVERIQTIAEKELGLTFPKKPAMVIQVKKSDLEKVKPAD